MNEMINIKFSQDEILVLFKCLIAVLSFAVTLDDALETKRDLREIQRIKVKIYNAAMNERKQRNQCRRKACGFLEFCRRKNGK